MVQHLHILTMLMQLAFGSLCPFRVDDGKKICVWSVGKAIGFWWGYFTSVLLTV